MSDPFRDELEAAHHRLEKVESEHKARIEKLEKEKRVLEVRLAEAAPPSRTKTGQTFLALAVTTMALSIGAGMVYARAVSRPVAVVASSATIQLLPTATMIELGPAPSNAPPSDFDRVSVAAALDAVPLEDCISSANKPGSGHVRLVILANGFVASAKVDRGNYMTTSEGRCIEDRFRAAHVPTWTGEARTIGKAFEIH